MESIKKKVFELAVEVFTIPFEQLTDSLGPDEIAGWSSLRHFQLIREIEEEFKIQFLTDEVMDISTIKDIIEIVEEKVKNGT